MKVIYLRIILFITNTINKTLCYNICERFCFCLTFEDYSKLDFAPPQSLRKKKSCLLLNALMKWFNLKDVKFSVGFGKSAVDCSCRKRLAIHNNSDTLMQRKKKRNK